NSEMHAQTLINRFRTMSTLDSDNYRTLHEDTINLLRDMLRKFPEFLCEYHFEFMGAISPQGIEMRSLISCAYPRYMDLPNRMNTDRHVDELPEMQLRPPTSPAFVKIIEKMPFKSLLDSYLETGNPVSVFPTVLHYISRNDIDHYAIFPRINAIVLYVGIHALKNKDMTPSIISTATSFHNKFFSSLIDRLDYIGRRYLLTAIVDQLTYINGITQYFSRLLHYLFEFESILGEQVHREIAIVIVERVPFQSCPWGLVHTVGKLSKIPLFDFYANEYFDSSTEIQGEMSLSTLQLHDQSFTLYTLLICYSILKCLSTLRVSHIIFNISYFCCRVIILLLPFHCKLLNHFGFLGIKYQIVGIKGQGNISSEILNSCLCIQKHVHLSFNAICRCYHHRNKVIKEQRNLTYIATTLQILYHILLHRFWDLIIFIYKNKLKLVRKAFLN
ncbi:hypothetical protein ACJMK2_037830, partial [Sinanodonta woodiana]